MAKKARYQYRVEVYRRKDGRWESRCRLAHGRRNIIYTSHEQGYENGKDALKIARNVFGTGYGFQFFVQQDNGKFMEVRPW